MARPVADLCMFCTDEGPCAKHAPKVKAKPRAPRKAPTAAPIVKSNTRSIPSSRGSEGKKADVTAAMKAAAQIKHQGSTIKEDHDAQDETTAILGDPEFTSAIQALESLMHPTERRRFAQVLDAKPDHRSRAAAWKQRTQR
jgi:hypothetical protein